MYKYLILIFSVVLVVSCTTSSSSGNASLAGTISLLNSDDHSGVTVALYNLAYLDTTLVRINQQYPHIGVIITQETEFDHRLQTPVKFTQTDLAGNFKLEGIRPGKYNLALLKEGYSLKYIYNLHLSEGSNTLSTSNSKSTSVSHCEELVDEAIFNSKFKIQNSKFDNSSLVKNSSYTNDKTSNSDFEPLESFAVNNNSTFNIQNSKLNNSSVVKNALNSSSVSSVANMFYLYPSVLIPPVVSIPITFQTGVQYNFPQNTIITAPVIIEPGSILAVGVNRKIDFHSTISTPETGIRWWLTSSHSINALPDQAINTKSSSVVNNNSKLNEVLFDRINIISPSHINITNAKVTFINSGINITAPSTNIINSYFDHNANAIAINGGEIEISNILHKNSTDRSVYVTYNTETVNDCLIFDGNLCNNNEVGIDIYDCNAILSNNYFINDQISIRLWENNHIINNNNFHNNYYSIYNQGSDIYVNKNIFLSSNFTCIYFKDAYGVRSFGKINQNTFYNLSNYCLYIQAHSIRQLVKNNISAINNYFKCQEVNQLIHDKYDDDRIYYEFIYIPRANNPIPNAGIL